MELTQRKDTRINQKLILTIKDIEIRKYDDDNVQVWIPSEGINPKTRELVKGFRSYGYFPSVFMALGFMVERGILDNEEYSDLRAFIEHQKALIEEIKIIAGEI